MVLLQSDTEPVDRGERQLRETMRNLLRQGALDSRRIHLDIPDGRMRVPSDPTGMNLALNEIVGKVKFYFYFLMMYHMP